MTYRGRVQNGAIVIEKGVQLPEGTELKIETVDVSERPTHAELFANIIGQAKDLPEDFAENHDHYIHGAPKRI